MKHFTEDSSCCRKFLALFTLLVGIESPMGWAADVRNYGVVKGQSFVQTNATSVVASGPSNFVFWAFVSPNEPGGVTNASVLVPNSAVVSLDTSEEFQEPFVSQAALDAAYPNGVYTAIFQALNDGWRTNRIAVTGDVYLPTPRLSNFAAAQAVNPTNDFLLTWDPIAGATSNDFISISIRDCNGYGIMDTGGPAEPTALNGLATSLLIPGRTLGPGQSYSVELLAGRFTTFDPTNYPGAQGLGGYLKSLKAPLVTVGAPANCPLGRLRMDFHFPAGGFLNQTNGVLAFPTILQFYSLGFGVIGKANPPSWVVFNGPPGSGLSDTTNNYYYTGGDYTGYSFASLSVPPFPPGGTYTVSYDGTNYDHYILDPDAAHQQVILVPTAVVNGSNYLERVEWTCRDTNGNVIAAPAFIRQIDIRVEGTNQTLYATDNLDLNLAPPATSHVLAWPVPWSSVMSIRLSWSDPPDNSYSSSFYRTLNGIEFLTAQLPEATEGVAYAATLLAFGGSGVLTWDIAAGALPGDLTLDPGTGQIAGIPATNGTFNFTVRVADTASHTNTRSLSLTVHPPPPNLPPTISDIPDQTILMSSVTPAIAFAISDEETPASSLELAGLSSNTNLVRQTGIVFGGANGLRTVTVTPVTNQTGSATITVSVSDGTNTVSDSFIVTVDPPPPGPDASMYLLAKRQRFDQNDPGNPAGSSLSDAFRFETFVVPRAQGTVTGVTLRLPDDQVTTLVWADGQFTHRAEFGTKAALDSAYPAGTYIFTIQGVNDGDQTPALSLPGDIYPGTPRIANWEAAQAVPCAVSFPFTWDSFTNGDANDYVEFTIRDEQGQEIFRSPSYGSPGALTGLSNGVVVPALTLSSARTYQGELTFANLAGSDTNAYPGVPGLVAFLKETTFPILTTNPVGQLRFSTNQLTVGEGEGTVNLRVLRTGGAAGTVGATYTVSAQNATPGQDYVLSSGTVSFAAGVAFQDIALTVVEDNLTEGTERLTLTLSQPTGGATLGWPGELTVGIQDNDPAPADVAYYAVAKAQNFVQTGAGTASPDPTAPFLFLASVEGTLEDAVLSAALRSPNATVTSLSADGPAMFKAEQSFSTQAAMDSAFGNGTYLFTLVTTNDGIKSPSQSLSGNSYPNTPLISNWADAQAVDAAAPFTLSWNSFAQGTTNDFIQISIHQTNGTDVYRSERPGQAGALSGTANSVQLPAGTLQPGQGYEGELLFVKFSSINTNAYPGAKGLGGYLRHTTFSLATLSNPPPQGRLQFGAPAFSVSETNPVAVFTITRTGGSAGAVSAHFATADGTATAGSDYTGTSGMLVLADGETNVSFTFPVLNDSSLEGNETVRMTLSLPSGGVVLGAQTNALMTIMDDELAAAGSLAFSAPTFRAAESRSNATVTVKRLGGRTGTVTVQYASTGGSATAGADYTAVSGTLTFGPGVTSQKFNIPIWNDGLDETNETIQIALSAPTGGASLGAQRTATVVIADNDTAGVLNLGAVAYSIQETGLVLTVPVKRSGGKAGNVTVDYLASGGTATAGADYIATTGSLNFGSNELVKTISVPILDDALAEGPETFTLRLSNPTGQAKLGTKTNAVITVVDNEPWLQFSASNYVAAESSGRATLTVLRGGPATESLTVQYATSDGSAQAGSDYTPATGTLTFGPGVLLKTFVVPILNDASPEPAETVSVTLSNLVGNAQIGPRGTATLIITDNDPPLSSRR